VEPNGPSTTDSPPINPRPASSERITEPIRQSADQAIPVDTFKKAGGFLLETLQTILLALVLYFLIDSVVARVRVENISMKPTLLPGEFVLVNKMAYRFGAMERGDIIVFHFPQNPQEDYIKRIIGLPGDQVKIDSGKVTVNDTQLAEEYISASPSYNGNWKVPEGSIFVLGDNRNQSSDSHQWGFVPASNVVGKAVLIYWPFSKLRLLEQTITVNAAH
jgi:signal peptidase I